MIKTLAKYIIAVPIYTALSIFHPAALAWFVTGVASVQAIMATYQYITIKSHQEKVIADMLNKYKDMLK